MDTNFSKFISLSKIANEGDFCEKLKKFNSIKNNDAIIFMKILGNNKDKFSEIKDNEKLLDFILKIVSKEEIERYEIAELEEQERIKMKRIRTKYFQDMIFLKNKKS